MNSILHDIESEQLPPLPTFSRTDPPLLYPPPFPVVVDVPDPPSEALPPLPPVRLTYERSKVIVSFEEILIVAFPPADTYPKTVPVVQAREADEELAGRSYPLPPIKLMEDPEIFIDLEQLISRIASPP